jgi:phosphotriesterase-related protein
MSTVATVRGPVDVDELGTTLMHEHVFVLTTEVLENYGVGAWWDEEARVSDAIERLRALRERGVRTIVDPTVVGIGRDIPRIQRINAEVDINIIPATGLYTYNDIPFFFHYRGPGTIGDGPEIMAEMFIGDIRDGIAGTKVKAAFLKCCVDAQGLTPGVERVLRAVALTHRETGAPITVHTNAHEKSGRLALRVFKEEGVDLTRVVIGHSGDSNDLDYLKELMDTGAVAGMDRFGLDVFNPTADRVATIAALAADGYADRMVLSHDAACFMDYFPTPDAIELLHSFAPNWHYNHIHDDVLPALREHGVDDAQITQMLVDNPRRYFAGGTH